MGRHPDAGPFERGPVGSSTRNKPGFPCIGEAVYGGSGFVRQAPWGRGMFLQGFGRSAVNLGTDMGKTSIVVRAPAKVNLALDVLGRRADGYHEIVSVMQTLELADRVCLERVEGAAELVCLCSGGDPPAAGEENLALRALRAMERRLQRQLPVRLTLEKHIPVAAGLGGGSSDAAAVLWGLNVLFRLGLTREMLAEIAVKLGADVPFFLIGGTALARGIGERLTPLSFPGAWPVVLAKPALSVSTADVYRGLNLGAVDRRPDIAAMETALRAHDFAGVCRAMGNVLETVTVARHPVVARLKGRLAELGAPGVLMSGSGPTVFALAADREHAELLAEGVRDLAETVCVTAFSSCGVGGEGHD